MPPAEARMEPEAPAPQYRHKPQASTPQPTGPDVTVQALQTVLQEMANVARRSGRPLPRLLAVSKHQPATAIAELAAVLRASPAGTDAGHREQAPAFGENYVQEARDKIAALSGLGLEWHLIGHLQSNKAADAAQLFDWVQTVDRPTLAQALDLVRQRTGA